MIRSASEFLALRSSRITEEYWRAAHDTASEEVWIELIEKYPDMRFWVAHNRTIPLRIIKMLSEDKDTNVRCRIADKHTTDPSILLALVHDREASVRMRVALNKKTPAHILRGLLNDEWDSIVAVAQKRLDDRDHIGS